MSVFIKGMKMPKNCDKCPCCCDLGCAVKHISMTTKQMIENRPDWCPLAELPSEHGRLIDADEIYFSMTNSTDQDIAEEAIRETPTVIESEGEE